MIVVTGATGQLGRLVVEGLLEQVPAEQLAVVVRSPEKAAGLADRGVRVHTADYSAPETLKGAFAAGDKVLLISGSELGRRIAQHRAVVDAAADAGAALLAYTSVLGADTAAFRLAEEHQATEAAIRASGLPFVLLRHGWYTENYTAVLEQTLEHGAVLASAGEGRVASAARADYAAAAVAVLTSAGHENRAYELSGDTAWSFAEYAAAVAEASGRPVAYRSVPAEAHLQVLLDAGLPRPVAEMLVDVDAGIARGELALANGDLARLIGRPTTPMPHTVKAALGR